MACSLTYSSAVRILGGLVVSVAALALAGCGTAADPDPADGSGETPTSAGAVDLPVFSVEAMLTEVPASVITDDTFELRVGDLSSASELAGATRPDEPEDAPAWTNALMGVGDSRLVHVPLTLPLSPNAPAPAVEEDLGWSIVDVHRFVSWTSINAITTVVAGSLGPGTLAGLPEAGGMRSAGEGADLDHELANASPARPLGVPMRMVAEDGWLIETPFSSVAREWRTGTPTLGDVPALAGLARALDARDSYAAYLSTPVEYGTASLPPGVAEALGLRREMFPDTDAYAIGWSVTDGEPTATVAFHDRDGRGTSTTRRLVQQLWTGDTSRGQPVSDLVTVERVSVEGDVVVLDLSLPSTSLPDHLVRVVEFEDIMLWSR